MSSIRTLMFGWEYPPHHLGGLGVACQGLVCGLTNNGIAVTLVLPFANDREQDGAQILGTGGTVVTQRDLQRIPLAYDSAESYRQRMEKMPSGMRDIYGGDLGAAVAHYTDESVVLTENIETDVIHCHDWMTYEAGARVATKKHRPLVTHVHATELDRTHFHPNEWIYERERYGFERADCIVTVSEYTKALLEKHYGIPSRKIRVVHNALHDSYRTPHKESAKAKHKKGPLVLFLGRLTIQKGCSQFLEMAAEVHKLRPDVTFVVAGSGDQFTSMLEKAGALGLTDSVIFAGAVNSCEARTLYASADCFVMPSVSEPFGLVALEAAAHGVPLVLSKQSGVAEVVQSAFVVDFWDTEKMADCVLTILREQPLARQLISEAPRTVQRLTWDTQAKHIHSIYKHLLHPQS